MRTTDIAAYVGTVRMANVLSALMRTPADAIVVRWLDRQPVESLWITSITLFEAKVSLALLPDGRRQRALEAAFAEDFGMALRHHIPYSGRTDRAIFRPSSGQWWILKSSDDSTIVIPWGISTDKPAPGDYDGDGRTDAAVFRDGTWFILQSSDGHPAFYPFGTTGDIPITGSTTRRCASRPVSASP